MSWIKKMNPNKIRSARIQIESRKFKPLEKILKKIEKEFPKYDMIKPYLKHKFIEFIYDFKPSAEKLAKVDHRSNRGSMIYALYQFRHDRGLFTPYIEVYPIHLTYCTSREIYQRDPCYVVMECMISEWFFCLNKKNRHVFLHREYRKWETEFSKHYPKEENRINASIRPDQDLYEYLSKMRHIQHIKTE